MTGGRRLSVVTTLVLVAGMLSGIFGSLPDSAGNQSVIFAADEDALWEKFTRGPCSLIVGVPMVPAVSGLTPMTAVASSVIGYYERSFPILGPPLPERVPHLVAASASAINVSDTVATERLEQRWFEAQQQASEIYFRFAKTRPQTSEGVVRAFALQEYGVGNIEGLEKIAAWRWQKADIKKARFATSTVRDGKPVIVPTEGGRSALLAVGNYPADQEWVIAIDPLRAKLVRRKAEDVLLTERDRTSTGDFAQKAREALRGEYVVVDEQTTCSSQTRPPGLRFVDASKLRETEGFVVRNWAIDAPALRKSVKD